MKNGDDYKVSLILSLFGIIPVVWLALLTAPYVSGGIVEIIENLSVAINNPFSITHQKEQDFRNQRSCSFL